MDDGRQNARLDCKPDGGRTRTCRYDIATTIPVQFFGYQNDEEMAITTCKLGFASMTHKSVDRDLFPPMLFFASTVFYHKQKKIPK